MPVSEKSDVCVNVQLVKEGQCYESKEGPFCARDDVQSEARICDKSFFALVKKTFEFMAKNPCPGCKIAFTKDAKTASESMAIKIPAPAKTDYAPPKEDAGGLGGKWCDIIHGAIKCY